MQLSFKFFVSVSSLLQFYVYSLMLWFFWSMFCFKFLISLFKLLLSWFVKLISFCRFNDFLWQSLYNSVKLLYPASFFLAFVSDLLNVLFSRAIAYFKEAILDYNIRFSFNRLVLSFVLETTYFCKARNMWSSHWETSQRHTHVILWINWWLS